jgi:hypothetical protein
VAQQLLSSIAVRVGAGHGLWTIAAFLFPTLAIIRDDSVILAILLFVLETLLASLVLAARTLVAVRGGAHDGEAGRRVTEARRVLLFFVAPFGLGCMVMFAAVALIEYTNGRLPVEGLGLFRERATWMATMLLASAALDTLIAPVRSVQWLETAVAWQGSRTSVMTLVLLVGWPVILVTGTSQGFFWVFFAFRLLSDVGSLWPGQREQIRARMFEGPGDPATPNDRQAKAPPPFSTAHARHDANQSRRRLP